LKPFNRCLLILISRAGKSARKPNTIALLALLYFLMVTFCLEVFMNAITVTLSDDRLAQLQEMATRFQVSPEELVRVGVEELLAQPDDVFQRVVAAVLKKNAELYRRLA